MRYNLTVLSSDIIHNNMQNIVNKTYKCLFYFYKLHMSGAALRKYMQTWRCSLVDFFLIFRTSIYFCMLRNSIIILTAPLLCIET